MYIYDSVEVKRPLGYWKELLQEWTFMVHRVFRISQGRSSAHAEKERSNTGLLAAAAIRTGWVALEECRTEKYNKDSVSKTYNGRCDLVLWRDRRHHEIEAKFVRVSVNARSNSKIIKAYDKAFSDSSRSTPNGYNSDKKIAIAYVVPTIKQKSLEKMSKTEIAVRLKSMISDIKENRKPALMAYAFPGPIGLVGSKSIGLGVVLAGDITA